MFVVALLGFGAAIDGFSHALHPMALLGARGAPHWWGFDLFGFVLPGLLAWWVLVRIGRASESTTTSADAAVAKSGRHWSTGIGWTLCALSALAFALQGALPVDAEKGLGYGLGRLHVAAWTVWWIAFVAGAVLLAIGAQQMRVVRVVTLVVAAIVLGFAMLVVIPGAPALGQRIACVAWFGWVWWMARVSMR